MWGALAFEEHENIFPGRHQQGFALVIEFGFQLGKHSQVHQQTFWVRWSLRRKTELLLDKNASEITTSEAGSVHWHDLSLLRPERLTEIKHFRNTSSHRNTRQASTFLESAERYALPLDNQWRTLRRTYPTLEAQLPQYLLVRCHVDLSENRQFLRVELKGGLRTSTDQIRPHGQAWETHGLGKHRGTTR